jgi:1-acyl-sn-glycerol-3-phosphate acyltransferase
MKQSELIEKIKELEAKGIFDEHVDPIDYSIVKKVDEKFRYENKTLSQKLRIFVDSRVIINPFVRKHTFKSFDTRFYGMEKIKGIKGAMVTCNHVHMFDCLVVKYAFRKSKLKVIGADFNYRSDFLGKMMIEGGMYPLASDYRNMKRFNHAIDFELEHGHKVLIFPEQSEWLYYSKPRPRKPGAYHFAARNNVPVIPTFITFRHSGIFSEDGVEQFYFDYHVLDPIYPDPSLTIKENVEFMSKKDYEECAECYKQVYGKDVVYDGKEVCEGI